MTREEVFASRFFGTSLELRLMLGAMALGLLFGAVFDLFRALRMSVRHPRIAVFAEDALFVLIFAVSCYSFCTALCRGQIRIFVFLAAAVGFMLYIATLGRIVCRIIAELVSFVKKIALGIVKVAKKILGDLCGVPFFQNPTNKIDKNPCADGDL